MVLGSVRTPTGKTVNTTSSPGPACGSCLHTAASSQSHLLWPPPQPQASMPPGTQGKACSSARLEVSVSHGAEF